MSARDRILARRTKFLRQDNPTVFTAGEEVLGAYLIAPKGTMNRQSLNTGVGQALGPFLGGVLSGGIAGAAGTIGEKKAEDSCLTRFPIGGMMMLAITNRRFLIFGQNKGWGLRPTYHYLSQYALDDILDMKVSGGMSARELTIKFADEGSLALDLPRGQGDADGLPSALREAKHSHNASTT